MFVINKMLPTDNTETLPKTVLRFIWGIKILKEHTGLKNESEIRNFFKDNMDFLEIYENGNKKIMKFIEQVQKECDLEFQDKKAAAFYKKKDKRRRRSISDGTDSKEISDKLSYEDTMKLKAQLEENLAKLSLMCGQELKLIEVPDRNNFDESQNTFVNDLSDADRNHEYDGLFNEVEVIKGLDGESDIEI